MNLRTIATEWRKISQQEELYLLTIGVRKLVKILRMGKFLAKGEINKDFETKIELFKASVGEEKWIGYWSKAIYNELGDPRKMILSGLKQHSKLYWNPTKHKLNVHALGIFKELDKNTKEPEIWHFVDPGQQIPVPWGLTVGGKYAAVKGVAPQLIPLPNSYHPDIYQEITPLTYNEWCAFGEELAVSECCSKQLLWDEAKSSLICQKCGHANR